MNIFDCRPYSMDHKKTLGGSKKLSFAPKKIEYSNITEEILLQHQESEKNIDIKKLDLNRNKFKSNKKEREKVKNTSLGVESFGASNLFVKKSNRGSGIEIVDEEIGQFKFDAENEPRMCEINKNDTCIFGDDVLYLFNGLDINEGKDFEVEVDDDGTSFLVIDKKIKHNMQSRECEKITAVTTNNKEIKEIGCLFSLFTILRKQV